MGKKIIFMAVVLGLLSPGASAATSNQESLKVGNTIVTAQKKEEGMQQVPISMDIFSGMNLRDAQIENTADLIRFSPNVHMKESHVEHAVMIRGISSYHSSVYSPAGYYVDDVGYPLHYMQNSGLMDIERVEILKGPQGTLYGRNSESGVINIITRKPGNTFYGELTSDIGEYDTYKAGASLSGPLKDNRLFFGGAFRHQISDGYVKDPSTGSDTVQDHERTNGRMTLRWTPSDPWDISLIADMMENRDHGGGFRFISGPHKTDRFRVQKDCNEYVDQDGNSQALRIQYKGNRLTVLSVTSALDQSLNKRNDADGWNDPGVRRSNTFKIDEEMISQEFRISSADSGPFEWLVGLYGFDEDTRFDFRYDFETRNKVIMHPETDIDARGYALFGQGTYTFFDRLHLTAGLRLDHQELIGKLRDRSKGVAFEDEVTCDEVLPKISAAYDIAKEMMVYGSASKGYLVGGFNWLNTDYQGFTFAPEYTWNYETGIKTAWLDNRLMVNLSLFYIAIDDKQVAEIDRESLGSTITNAADAHSSGLEIQVQARPARGLTLFAGLGVNESKFDRFKATQWNPDRTALIENDYGGNFLPYAPELTYNAGLQYRSPNHLFWRADIMGTDKFYADPANSGSQSAYRTVNLTVGYEAESFDVYVWAKNLFDEAYCTWIMPMGNNSMMGLDGAPQTFGITLNYRL